MLKSWTRVLVDKDGSIVDRSILNQNGDGFSSDLSSSEFIYIGQYFPFNNFSVDLIEENAVTGAMTVEYWDGNEFIDMVDLLDGSTSGGATFALNGTVQFQPNKNNSWSCISDTSDESGFPLSGFHLYDLYWARISVQNQLTAATKIKHLRYKFCEHNDLIAVDPEINDYLNAWGGATKTTWDEQIYQASDNIISELRERKLIFHPGQILRFEDVHKACVYQTLLMIYSQLGESFKPKFDNYQKLYKQHLGDKRFTFDTNKNAQVEYGEQDLTQGEGFR